MREMQGNRRRSIAVAWMAGAALAAGLGAGVRAADAGDLRVTGRAGEIRCEAAGRLQVTGAAAGPVHRWVIRPEGTITVAAGLEAFVKKIPEGVAVEVPSGAGPALTWMPQGLLFRWTTGSDPGGASDVFATTTPPAYPLGPGDKLQITVYNEEDMNQTVVVDPSGAVTFPVLDKVDVQGLSVNQLQTRLEDLLGQFVKAPQVNLQLIEYGSRYVNVLGEVGNPGRVPLKGALKVLDAVSQAGGYTSKSGDVEISRRDASGKLHTRVFPREELLGASSEKGNIYVLDQDVINVQAIKSVYVSGEVKNPGSFPYNRDITLLRAITLAGGFTQWAKKDRVDVLRETPDSAPRVIEVDVSDIERGKREDVPLLPNDHVVVKERKFF
ncbi:MAG: SLBB domain-containing protein [Acidobacteriota bacterium]